MHYSSTSESQLFMRYKRKDLKWYKKFWNYITGHKDRNWEWLPFNDLKIKTGI